MKKLFQLFVFLFFLSFTLNAQKVYFIYLQTDNNQPFYARMGEKVYNSSPAGYLIISNLRDSTYSLNIGIKGGQVSNEPYTLTINRKDQGYLIRNFGDRGWGLFNLNTMAVTMPEKASIKQIQNVKTERREDNAFTNLLAKAADDSTIKERPVMVKSEEKKEGVPPITAEKKGEPTVESKNVTQPRQEEVKKVTNMEEPVSNVKKQESAEKKQPIQEIRKDVEAEESVSNVKKQEELKKLTESEPRKDEPKKDLPVDLRIQDEETGEAAYQKSVVKLKSESSTTRGIGLVFLDISSNATDTISIFIPAEAKTSNAVESKQEEKKFLDIVSADTSPNQPAAAEIKSNACGQLANDDDFFKLRKKMAGETSDDDMINEAKKVFRTKCFSTQQIKNLSSLFLTDEYKYKFFDVSYQFSSDLENFPALQTELKEEYYINRFKAMLR